MKSVRMFACALALPALSAAFCVAGCEKKPDSSAKPVAKSAAAPDGHDHAHDHDHHDGDNHGHGPSTELGTATAGDLTVMAIRYGAVTPGAEATFNVAVSGGAGKPAAVRLWVGAQDARGSVKARCELEGDEWHAHVEVPTPLPADGKLWVEVETSSGEKHAVGFDLKS